MSWQACADALRFRGLRPTEKLLLLTLANYADAENRCWPSHSTLAADTGVSERTILTSFKKLEDEGALRRERRARPDGSRASDVVTLTLERGHALSWGGEKIAPRGEAASPGVGKQLRGGGETASPHEQSTDQSKYEQSREDSPSQEAGSATVDVVGRDQAQTAFDLWNETAERVGLSAARVLTPDRRKQIHARLSASGIADGGLDAWREALAAVERSSFCCGGGQNGWRIDLGSLCQAKTFNRLLDGYYDDRSRRGAAGRAQGGWTALDQAAAMASFDDGDGEPLAITGAVH